MSYFSSLLASVNDGSPRSTNLQSASNDKDDANPTASGPLPAYRQASAQSRSLKRKLDAASESKPFAKPHKASEWTGTAMRGPPHPEASTAPPTTTAQLASSIPKKGSYKEILARAQAAKSIAASSGKITHKSQQFLSKREREKLEAEAKAKAKACAAVKSNGTGSRLNRKGMITKPQPLAKAKKDRPPLAYQGTARPAGNRSASSSKSSSKRLPTSTTIRKDSRNYSDSDGVVEDDDDGHKRYRYAGSSEDEAEDNSMGDDSDDMGGGGFAELEEEEEQTLRAARKEDAAALREENEHKQAKLERKKKLAALAAKAGRR